MARVVTRWKKTARRRLAIGGAALTIGASILFVVGVLPASAHSALLSGRTVCGNGTHVIRWSIGNDYGLPMTITSASATKGTTSYAVTGYHATVGPVGGASDTTSATTVVPGSETGNVTLRVHARWSDGFTASASTSVSLIGPCGSTGSTTTTTLVTQGSTLPPPTTTSTIESATTTLVTQGSTQPPPTTTSTIASTGSTVAAPTTGPPTSNSASNGGTPVGPLGGPTRPSGGSSIARQLPFTGSGYVGPMLGVGSLVLGGVAVAAGSARKRRRETM